MRDGLRIRKRIRAGWDQMAAGALDNARGRIDRFGATSWGERGLELGNVGFL
jgi:hypothetical protein